MGNPAEHTSARMDIHETAEALLCLREAAEALLRLGRDVRDAAEDTSAGMDIGDDSEDDEGFSCRGRKRKPTDFYKQPPRKPPRRSSACSILHDFVIKISRLNYNPYILHKLKKSKHVACTNWSRAIL